MTSMNDPRETRRSLHAADGGSRRRIVFIDALKPREISFPWDIMAAPEPDSDIRYIHPATEARLTETLLVFDKSPAEISERQTVELMQNSTMIFAD